ncbi:MAG: hypothetical protein ACI8RN_002886, partial [Glaciecola sp.]
AKHLEACVEQDNWNNSKSTQAVYFGTIFQLDGP